MGSVIDETGNRYGRLVVIERGPNDKRGAAQWWCQCDCGERCLALGIRLRRGRVRSCGCLRKEQVAERVRLPHGVAAMRRVYRSYRKNARERGLAWNLSIEEFEGVAAQPCHYCGALATNTWGDNDLYNGAWNYNGLDRIDSSKGYTPDNVVPCCTRCNYAKHDMTTAEFKAWVQRVYGHMDNW